MYFLIPLHMIRSNGQRAIREILNTVFEELHINVIIFWT